MKDDALSLAAAPTEQCAFEYRGGPQNGIAALCWTVTVSNTSDRRLSIVSSQLQNLNGGANVQIGGGGFQTFETPDGQPVALPISLDSGEARTMIVHAPMLLDRPVNDALRKGVDEQHLKITELKLEEVNKLLAGQKTDLLGNEVELTIVDPTMHMRTISSPFKRAENLLTLTTGRAATFVVKLVYPSEVGGRNK
jgi:hypothetical protein